MNTFRVALLLIFAALATLEPVSAGAASKSKQIQVSQTFAVQVIGAVDATSTFWVAYGPVNGRFSIVQLHSSDRHNFTSTRLLPLRARTTFTYLTSTGRMHTRSGWTPAGQTTTIAVIGPVTISPVRFAVVQWQAPVG